MHFLLLFGKIQVVVVDQFLRKIFKYLLFSSTDNDGFQPFLKKIQVAVPQDSSFFASAKHEMVSGKFPKGCQQLRIKKLNDGVNIFKLVLQGCSGKYKGVIGQGGLVLARVPKEIAQQYADYYAKQARENEEAFDHDLMKDEHPSMPINIDRQTRVTFGGTKK